MDPDPNKTPPQEENSASSVPEQPGVSPAHGTNVNPDVSANEIAQNPAPTLGPKRAKLKIAVVAGVAAVVLAGASAGAYFGYYMNPNEIWKQGMNNSGQALVKMTDYAKQLQAHPPGKGIKMSGHLKATVSGATFDGTIDSQQSGKNSKSTLKLDAGVTQLGLEARTLAVPDDSNPDVYLKATGFKGLADLYGKPEIGNLDGQWVELDHTLIDDAENSQKTKGSNPMDSVTGANAMALAQSISKTTQQYVFSANSKTAAMKVTQEVGQEKIDGRNTYHYKVNFDKSNLKTYVQALGSDFAASPIAQAFAKSENKSPNDLLDTHSTIQSIDKMKSGYTADVWVDTGTRLVHKIRFPEGSHPGSYLDVGQNYTGGDNYPVQIATYSKQGADVTHFTLDSAYNTKTNVLTLKAQDNETGAKDSGSNGNALLNLTVSPLSSPVNVSAPAGAKSLTDVFDELGLGQYSKEITNNNLFNGSNPRLPL